MIECDSMTVTEVFFEAGAPYALHSHAAEQVCYVLKGLLRVWAGVGEVEPLDVAAGDIVQFASNVPHRIEAIEETLMVQVSTPRRQDIADRMRAAES
jgi:quercetin dioxygenase-like cupin family protein